MMFVTNSFFWWTTLRIRAYTGGKVRRQQKRHPGKPGHVGVAFPNVAGKSGSHERNCGYKEGYASQYCGHIYSDLDFREFDYEHDSTMKSNLGPAQGINLGFVYRPVPGTSSQLAANGFERRQGVSVRKGCNGLSPDVARRPRTIAINLLGPHL